ncbi:Cystatin cpi-1 [Dirofilaria immitis]
MQTIFIEKFIFGNETVYAPVQIFLQKTDTLNDRLSTFLLKIKLTFLLTIVSILTVNPGLYSTNKKNSRKSSKMLQLIVLLAIFNSFSDAQYENDPDVKDVISDSIIMINKKMKNPNLFVLAKILKAKVLVVQSTIYNLRLLLVPTSCDMKDITKAKIPSCRENRKLQKKNVDLKISERMDGKLSVQVLRVW